MQSCASCKHFTETQADPNTGKNALPSSGTCHRNPPAVIGALIPHPMTRQPALVAQTAWPMVSVNEHCGEYVAEIEGVN